MRLTSFHIKCIYLTVFVFIVIVLWLVIMRICKWWVKKKEAERIEEEHEIEEDRRKQQIEQLPPVSKLIEIYTSGNSGGSV